MRVDDIERIDDAHVLRHCDVKLEQVLDQADRIVPFGIVHARVGRRRRRIGPKIVSVGLG
jgi:hypothetical protein